MTTIHHKVDPGQHAACSITEVQNYSEEHDTDNLYDGDGFYFWVEDEASVMGPYTTSIEAIKARDAYYQEINK